MTEETNKGPAARCLAAVRGGAKAALGTSWFLARVMVPVSLAVAVLGWSGLLDLLAAFLAPAMGLIGLPGEAALAFISGALLNNYSAIAVMGSLGLDLRELTILSMMCLTAHNLLVETAVMRKTGSTAWKMVALRIGGAVASAFVLNLLLPPSLSAVAFAAPAVAGGAPAARPDFLPMLGGWGLATLGLLARIGLIVLVIMIAQRLFEEFRLTEALSRAFAPLMRFLGLSRDASLLWIVINVVGYAYGAGIVEGQVEAGRMKRQDADLFNHHAAMCHSLLEDTALYAALGAPLLWITLPRLALAVLVVWVERVRRHYFRRSFRAGLA